MAATWCNSFIITHLFATESSGLRTGYFRHPKDNMTIPVGGRQKVPGELLDHPTFGLSESDHPFPGGHLAAFVLQRIQVLGRNILTDETSEPHLYNGLSRLKSFGDNFHSTIQYRTNLPLWNGFFALGDFTNKIFLVHAVFLLRYCIIIVHLSAANRVIGVINLDIFSFSVSQ